jgi:hypothetical protein
VDERERAALALHATPRQPAELSIAPPAEPRLRHGVHGISLTIFPPLL